MLHPNSTKPSESKYYTCECGSTDFIRVHNVWNQKIKVEVTTVDGEELWDEQDHGVEKTHPCGIICARCRKLEQELTDGL